MHKRALRDGKMILKELLDLDWNLEMSELQASGIKQAVTKLDTKQVKIAVNKVKKI